VGGGGGGGGGGRGGGGAGGRAGGGASQKERPDPLSAVSPHAWRNLHCFAPNVAHSPLYRPTCGALSTVSPQTWRTLHCFAPNVAHSPLFRPKTWRTLYVFAQNVAHSPPAHGESCMFFVPPPQVWRIRSLRTAGGSLLPTAGGYLFLELDPHSHSFPYATPHSSLMPRRLCLFCFFLCVHSACAPCADPHACAYESAAHSVLLHPPLTSPILVFLPVTCGSPPQRRSNFPPITGTRPLCHQRAERPLSTKKKEKGGVAYGNEWGVAYENEWE
jgi:hypothetical protein